MNAKDEGQQWDIHTLNGQVVAAKGEPRAGAEMRSLAGMCDLVNALQQQVTELEEERDHYRAALGTIRHHAASFSVYSRTKERARTIAFIDRALTSPSTIAQEAQR